MNKDHIKSALEQFYNTLALAMSDSLPGGKSEYQKLKVRLKNKDLGLWESLEQEITTRVTGWPEWSLLINKGNAPATSSPKSFNRYASLTPNVKTPERFGDLNERFRSTADALLQQTLDYIDKAIGYSLSRFEKQPDYQKAVKRLQTIIPLEKIQNIKECMPLLDAWQLTHLQEEITSTVLDRITDEKADIENLSYPYDLEKPCTSNLAILLRVQVQIQETYRDKFSRLSAAAQSKYQNFITGEVLQAEILPRIRELSLNQSLFKRL